MIQTLWEGVTLDYDIRLLYNTALRQMSFATREGGKWNVHPIVPGVTNTNSTREQLEALAHAIQDFYQDRDLEGRA